MSEPNMTDALALGAAIEAGKVDPRAVTEMLLARIEDVDTDRSIFVVRTQKRARAEAAAAHDRAKRGLRRSPLDGVPISWKDLYGSAGDVTAAGSRMLIRNVPETDAEVLARATRAGLVCIGKTGMTELAFSGLGINPAFGTPANPFDDRVARVPGGSSAGAGVSVARGLALAGIGSDTGGSVRVPAAWNGLVGFKTTAGLLPLKGVVPLSPSYDTVGPLTHTVADAAALTAILGRLPPVSFEGASLKGVRIGVPPRATSAVWQDMDEGIVPALEAALDRLAAAGATLVERDLPELDEINEIAWQAGTSRLLAEAQGIWGEQVRAHEGLVYRPVFDRIAAGSLASAADLVRSDEMRAAKHRAYLARTADLDAVAAPTVCSSPPPIAELVDGGDAYQRANYRALRNTTIGNQLGLCAITLPTGRDAIGLPVGLMLQTGPFREARLLRLAKAAEAALV